MFETNQGLTEVEHQNVEALKKHPLLIETIFGEPNAWKLIDKTKNGNVITTMLAKEIGGMGVFVQVQSENLNGQVYNLTNIWCDTLRIQEVGTDDNKLKRYDLTDKKSEDINKSNITM